MTPKLFIKLLMLAVLLPCMASAQKRSTPEFLQSINFKASDAGEWKNAAGATVVMDGDYVKEFTAPQTHNWEFVFGDGSKLGKTIKIKKGDNITFRDGCMTLPGNCTFKLLSADNPAMASRGILKSAIFSNERDVLNATDIKIKAAESYSIGWLNTTGKEQDEEALDESGNFVGKVLDMREEEERNRQKANQKYASAIAQDKHQNAINEYEEYCKKYGKDVIDRTINGDIVPGAPNDLLKRVIHKLSLYKYTTTYADAEMEILEVQEILYEPRTWHTHFMVACDLKKGVVDSFWRKRVFY